MRVLITRPNNPYLIELLKAAGHDVSIPTVDSPEVAAAIRAGGHDAQGLITFPSDRIDATFIASCPDLRAVSNHGVGYNHIDIAACTVRRIGVSNTPGVLTDATAEVAWTLIMMAARRASEGERTVRAKHWTGWGSQGFIGVDVVGRTLGILGAGRIGSRVARMARGFDMPLIYHNRKLNAVMDALGAVWVPFENLLRQSDYVSVHVPLTEQTHHLIGAPQFALMKPTAVLINTSRGPVVDEAALVEALRSRRIFAAGLDVYENEPTLHPGLYDLENAVLLPHIGSATADTRKKMAELSADNLIAMLHGKRPPHPLNPELWP